MKMILIGHRGVGKTTLLQRLMIYNSLRGETIPIFDLDREIEREMGSPVSEIFELIGEEKFREKEISTLQRILKKEKFIIALGAGFPLEKFHLPTEAECVWVKRKTDSRGRIFLDRPRLNKNLTARDEFQERFQNREETYRRVCHWVYEMPEGLTAPSEVEQQIFHNRIEEAGGVFTLFPQHYFHLKSFKAREWRWDFDFYEIRDDLLSDEQMEAFFALIAKRNILLSFRAQKISDRLLQAYREGYISDWPLEKGVCPFGKTQILSLHERKSEETFEQTLLRLQTHAQPGQILKLAVEVNDFSELKRGLAWQAEHPSRHIFLPRSSLGRWNWVRLWLKERQMLNFIRSGTAAVPDQPTLYEWLSAPAKVDEFAAVLGHPIDHSFSPVEHEGFFKGYELPFFAIDMALQDWELGIQLLEKMGLRCAAITSPLKFKAAEFAQNPSALVKSFGVANTLLKTKGRWESENTDFEGLQNVLSTIGELGNTVIWGGSGTLVLLKKLLPKAVSYSARTGKPREGEAEIIPKSVIWAATPDGPMPPLQWSPQIVLDLNYRDDSRAKEYCQLTGAKYISGLPMFKAQAQAQRNFWGKRYAGQ